MDFLKSAVASAISKGPLAAYNVAEKVELENSIWTLNNATKRDSGARCSIFTFDVLSNRNRIPIAKNALRRFRTLRHPGVAQVIDAIESDSQICVITERVTPLPLHRQEHDLQQETLKWGLHSIAKTLRFINEEASLVHSLVRDSSIFISESGEWKLGGFEMLSSTKDEHDNVIWSYSSLVPGYAVYMPPEVAKSSWDMYRSNSWSPVDAYGLGVLISEAFSGTAIRPSQAPDVARVPANLLAMVRRLLSANPKLRPSVGIFLDQGRKSGGYFQTPLISFSENIDSLGLKSDAEREQFLSELDGIKDDFPSQYAKRKILPELLKSVEFGGGGPRVLAVVLQIGSRLPAEEYDAQLSPVLVRLFSSPDRALRVYLLDSLSNMITHLPQKIVNDKIFPNLVTGFTDIAPLVREQTVKSILVLVTKLSERTINGDLLKYLAKTANDAEPGIRTNTTVCLGKIAKYIGQSTRSKVLVAAFTRSLRDPFVHARHAALMALAATVDMLPEDDCASRVLPAICPALIDKEKIIRDQAVKTMEIYMARLRKYCETLPESALPVQSAVSQNGTSAPAEVAVGSTDPGWAGWAISSFTSKVAETIGQIDPSANGGLIAPSATVTPDSSRPSTAVASNGQNTTTMQAQHDTFSSRQATGMNRTAKPLVAPTVDESWGIDDTAEEADEAWGTMDDDDETFFDASAKPAPTKTQAQPAPAADGKGEPDFAAWLAAKQAMTTIKKGPLPKGLATAAKSSAPKVLASTAKPVIRPTSSLLARSVPPAVAPRIPATTTAIKATTTQAPIAQKPVKPAATKAKDEDDGWGDAWD